ncbi:MAG: GDSL-type esterase/lipase family protein, partial [Peptococcaceae bacterium]|nr:GDSL-type esterase/lipase family protein [Peptococcaceae bacterium]
MKIVALGDSITEGFPYSVRDSWVHYAAGRLEIEILNRGICGNLTEEMLYRFDGDVLAETPTQVILLGGSNDAALRLPLAAVSENFEAMAALSAEHGVVPIIGLPILSLDEEIERWLGSYRDWLREFAAREKFLQIDFYAPFLAVQREGGAAALFADAV